jgi:hypothetical protein
VARHVSRRPPFRCTRRAPLSSRRRRCDFAGTDLVATPYVGPREVTLLVLCAAAWGIYAALPVLWAVPAGLLIGTAAATLLACFDPQDKGHQAIAKSLTCQYLVTLGVDRKRFTAIVPRLRTG